MTPSQNCINLIKQFEGFYAKSYLCPASVWTIGYGSTMWNDGQRVREGQFISLENAEKLLMWELTNKGNVINGLKLNLNQNQFDSVLSFVYNLGIGAFQKSTMLTKIKLNPNDASIRDEFMKWNKARVKGKLVELKGLTRRRIAESNLYYL